MAVGPWEDEAFWKTGGTVNERDCVDKDLMGASRRKARFASEIIEPRKTIVRCKHQKPGTCSRGVGCILKPIKEFHLWNHEFGTSARHGVRAGGLLRHTLTVPLQGPGSLARQ
jgi:hypothetical protein